MARPERAGVERGLAERVREASGKETDVVRIRLLGGFWVSVGERTIEENEWQLRKAESLVKLLALSPRHRLHREQILDLLWPDLDPKAADNNLHRTLYAARRALGSYPGFTPTSSSRYYLQLRGEQLALSPDGEIWTDVKAFEEAAKVAHRARDLGAYRAAIELYAGDLLPGDLYEDWTESRREKLRNAYLSLLLKMSAAYEEHQAFEPAIEALRRATVAEPAHEEANVGLMRLFALSGRRREASKHYEWFLETLEEEGAAPGQIARRLHADILAERFPPPGAAPAGPPPSPDSVLHNLPNALTSFVGREGELVEVKKALSMTRLLSLTGAGGSGKTRLALEVARDLVNLYPDGVWLVELATLAEGTLVPQAVSEVLNIREKPGRPLTDALVDALRSKKLLLVLDNCEHLVEEVARLAETLLKNCPGLRILATSREALGIPGETCRSVPPLALPGSKDPPTMEEIEGVESARLFIERAARRGSAFRPTPRNAGAVADICRQLDGLPLAIELAAARVGVLSVEQISERLRDSLGLLTSGSRTATPRQQTLEGALDWGHELLGEPEKELFGRLSVFAGGWTLHAAEAVGGAGDVLDLLSGLVDKSLVVAEPSPEEGALRYGMLEPIRQYARKKLEESGEDGAVLNRHALFFLAMAEEAELELKGPDRETWLGRLETEHDNLRAALRWALEREDDIAPRLAGALGEFWSIRGHLGEGRGWLEAALANGKETASARLDKVFFWAGHLAREQGDYEEAEASGEEGLRLAREMGDEASVAAVLYDLGLLDLYQTSYERSSARLEEALALQRELGDIAGVSLTLQALGTGALARRDHARASELHEEALALARETGDAMAMSFALGLGALDAASRGDHDQAKRLQTEGLRLIAGIGHERFIVNYLHICAVQAGAEGRLARAARLWGAAEALREAIDAALSPVETHYFGPYIAAVREGLDDAAREAAWAEGRAMSRDEAVEYALSEEEPFEKKPAAPLSPREREVARLVTEGLTNRQIAEVLGITRRTAETHVRKVLKKLGLDSREQIPPG